MRHARRAEEVAVQLEVTVVADAPRPVVWDVLTDWERQSEWMLDARSVEVLTPQREGVGVTIRCPTALLGITVEDVMRVTGWSAPARLEVTHLGKVITGSGVFELVALEDGRTRIDWIEEVTPPLGAVGEWGASRLVRPLLRGIFGRSLAGLAARAEQAAAAAT